MVIAAVDHEALFGRVICARMVNHVAKLLARVVAWAPCQLGKSPLACAQSARSSSVRRDISHAREDYEHDCWRRPAGQRCGFAGPKRERCEI
jgi:hypothetical protein